MAKTETLTVEVPEELVAAMRGAVHDGKYRSDDEVIADALAQWNVERSLQDPANIARIRAALKEVEDDDRPYLSMEEVFDPLVAKYRAMADAQRKG